MTRITNAIVTTTLCLGLSTTVTVVHGLVQPHVPARKSPLSMRVNRPAWSSKITPSPSSSSSFGTITFPIAIHNEATTSTALNSATSLPVEGDDNEEFDESCDPFDPESSEYCTTKPADIANDGLKRKIRLTGLFTLWYILNIGYNIGNKSVLNALPIPWTAATIELFFGFPYVLLLWTTGLRKTPKLSLDNIKTLSSSAFFLAATHVAGVVSFGAGAISFTHILKATEPVWAALISAVAFKEFLPLPVYATLIPIMGGVGIASMKELSFTWLAFISGTISAVTSASKAILSKKVLDGKPLGENLTPSNMFAVLTIMGFLLVAPAAYLVEGPAMVRTAWTAALANGHTNAELLRLLSASGFLYYLYNEVAFLALSEVAPVTHAVTNTVKRVVIILASVLVFRNPVTGMGMAGSGLAVFGAALYSIAKSKFKVKRRTKEV